MSRTGRLWLFVASAVVGAGLLAWGLAGLPSYGRAPTVYRTAVTRAALPEHHATNAVTAVVFDVRGFDTLGEESILFAAVIGVVLLLRMQREEHEERSHDRAAGRRLVETSDAVRVTTLGFIAPTVVVGLSLVAHGHLTPGGGFQGGAALAAAPLLIYLGGRYLVFRSLSPLDLIELGEGSGAAGFVAVGLGALAAGAAFLQNVLPFGRMGAMFSGGLLPVLNVVASLAVSAGMILVIYEFLEQTLMVRER